MNAQHTPGPWTVSHGDTGVNGFHIVAAENIYNPYVAITEHNDNQIANARLIAAAPELYDFVRAYANGELVDRTAAAALAAKAEGNGGAK